MSLKVLGLISGMGELPKAIALDAKAKGYTVVAIALTPISNVPLAGYVDVLKEVNVGRLGEIIRTLKKHNVTQAVMAGKVPKSLLYLSRIRPDLRAAKLLFSLKDRKDDSILIAVARELEKDGIRLLSITDFCASLMTPEGILTKKHPTEKEWNDIRFGFDIAKEIGRLDIGQTVVVKDRAVMAVEAIEGTDEAIRRGGKLAGKGAVVVKVSKPYQDMRFDVPTVGINTLEVMIGVKASVLAVEAGKSILLEREDFLKSANKAGIAVVGYKGKE
ncbi:MAG: UDP-2,3-diacylglucosamine diphosphatase LpxI [Nitrospirae bacterium]|nr:UDP-2,3-diacylglucosamine diphosphatase LpxI [Nitrospirota bacterium]